VRQPRHEADHSTSSSAMVKNEWSSTSIPPYAFMACTTFTHTHTHTHTHIHTPTHTHTHPESWFSRSSGQYYNADKDWNMF
jgi:hypothetical protein